jgi:hypothetical protein
MDWQDQLPRASTFATCPGLQRGFSLELVAAAAGDTTAIANTIAKIDFILLLITAPCCC